MQSLVSFARCGDARFEGEYQSMSSALCASAPSHPLHAMPPRFTRNSDRPRASDRTMVDTKTPGLACQPLQTRLASSSPEDEPMGKSKPARAKPLDPIGGHTYSSGLDVETKNLLASGRGGAFFLDILFIELIDPWLASTRFCVAHSGVPNLPQASMCSAELSSTFFRRVDPMSTASSVCLFSRELVPPC